MAQVTLESSLNKFIQNINATEQEKANIGDIFVKHRLVSSEMVYSFDLDGLYRLGIEYGLGLQLLKVMREKGIKKYDEGKPFLDLFFILNSSQDIENIFARISPPFFGPFWWFRFSKLGIRNMW